MLSSVLNGCSGQCVVTVPRENTVSVQSGHALYEGCSLSLK
jgi:hypothetical protein